MVADTRWPTIPLLILRGFQGVFGLVVLGLSGSWIEKYSAEPGWAPCMALVAGLFTMIYIIINFALFFIGLLLPLPILIVDALLLIFWLVALAGLGSGISDIGFFDVKCSDLIYLSEDCGVIKGDFALTVISFLLFIATLVIAAIVLHKNRKDLRGAKYNSGLSPDGEAIDMENQATDVQGQEQVYYEENKPAEYHQPEYQPPAQFQQPAQFQGADGAYYPQQQVQPIVSPPQTPAPYTQPQGYTNAASPPPPPPPPVNAQEMPATYR